MRLYFHCESDRFHNNNTMSILFSNDETVIQSAFKACFD